MTLAVVVWDGFRPDHLSPELTPNLVRLASDGMWLRQSRSAYPPHTRVNCASLVTGSWPIRHGLPANRLYVPELDEAAPVTLADGDTVRGLAALRGGELFNVPSLGRVLSDAGKTFCVVSAASRGSTSILGWQASAVICQDGPAVPAGLGDRVVAMCGRSPGRVVPSAVNEWVTQVATRFAIPELRPDVLLMWLCEPDASQHYEGVGSTAALAAIRANDRLLGDLVAAIGPDGNIMVLSDHGHTQVRRVGPTTVEAIERLTGLRSGEDFVATTSDGVYARGSSSVDDLVEAVQQVSTVGPVFTRAPHPEAMALETLQLGGEWAPDVKYSHTCVNSHVLAGAEQDYISTHGTLNTSDLNNLFVAAGPAFRRGQVSSTPCGIVDVAPTVLHLLGASAPDAWQGRVLTEALAGGADITADGTVVHDARQEVVLATVADTTYVMSGRRVIS